MPDPCLRWPGGKSRIARTLVELLGHHRVYVEPYFGSGAVLLAKPRSTHEIVNDLDDEVVNFYTVLRTQPEELIRVCRLTPCAESELRALRQGPGPEEPLEMARQFFARTCLAHGGAIDGGWVPNYKGGDSVATRWMRYLGRLGPVAERLQGVQVLHRDALDVIAETIDTPQAALYIDPPYLSETLSRRTGQHYAENASHAADHHHQMLELATRAQATVVISGYASSLYDDALTGWERMTVDIDHAGNPRLEKVRKRDMRTEIIWVNHKGHTLF